MTSDPETIRELAGTVAKTLLGADCYIVLNSDGPPAGTVIPGALGMTGRQWDLAIHPWLTARGLWQGRKRAIYVDDVAIVNFVAEHANESPAQSVDYCNRLT